MKNLYPKIKFVYSLPYNRMLAEYGNKKFEEEKISKEIKNYIKKLEPRWNKVSDSICRVLQEIVKNKWREKEIKCYVVKYCKYSGISLPLTLRMEKDFDLVIETLIHELTHIIVSYNFKKYTKIKQKLEKRFPKENSWVIRHIYINFIELQSLKKLFNQKFIDKILKRNLSLKGGRAWKIVLTKKEILKKLLKLNHEKQPQSKN